MRITASTKLPHSLPYKALLALSLWLLACLLATATYAQTEPGTAPVASEPSYAALADLLENETTRDTLIDQLRSLAVDPEAGPVSQDSGWTEPNAPDRQDGQSLSQRLAEQTQVFTASLMHGLSETADVVTALTRGHVPPQGDVQRWTPALNILMLTIASTLVAYFLFRMIARRGYGRLNIWIETHPTSHHFSRKLLGVLAALLIDIATTLLAALTGYLVCVTLTSGSSVPPTIFALEFLAAFVIIEVVKALSRGVFATRYEHLRLLPLTPESATYWNRWLTLIIGIVGYGLMVVVPVSEAIFTPGVARVVNLAIMLFVYVYGVGVVWKKRKSVRAGLNSYAERTSTAVFGTMLRILARTWHLVALIYFTVLLVVTQTSQRAALTFMVEATSKTVITILVGLALSAALTSLLSRYIKLPEDWNKALPLFESRINGYMPMVLSFIRTIIAVAVALLVFDAWRVFDLADWLQSPGGRSAITMVFHIAFILAAAALSWTILASIIEHRLGGTRQKLPTQREKTLLLLFRNAATIVIVVMTILVLLSQIGIDIGPLIAGAGMIGLAISFGAQKLVQDVITGVFIQLENGMNQNDVVELADVFGTVEKVTIRSVFIRSLDGGYHLIPFSTVDKFTNHTRDYGYHYGEYNIAHRESVDQAIEQLELAFKDFMQDVELAREVIGDIEIPGVTGLTERGFTIRVLIKTTPGMQWAVQRAFNRRVKARFDAAGIEMPYPQTVVHFGRDKDGFASPVDVRSVDALREVAGKVPPAGQTMRPVLGHDD